MIEGLPVSATISDVPVDSLDRVSMYVPPSIGLTMLDAIVAKGCQEFWLNPGSESDQLIEAARARGLDPIIACSIVDVGRHPGGQAESAMPEDPSKSLTELEGNDWGAPTYDSRLVETVHGLRDKPIGGFSIEELRITIGQNVGLRHLIPIAIERLNEDPLAEGDFYPGDLLRSLLTCDPVYWSGCPDKHRQVREIAERGVRQLEASDDPAMTEGEGLRSDLQQFDARA